MEDIILKVQRVSFLLELNRRAYLLDPTNFELTVQCVRYAMILRRLRAAFLEPK